MKFYDTNGHEHKIDVRPSRWPKKDIGEGRGKFQSEVGDILAETFPGHYVLEEFPCLGERLFLDFYVPSKKIAVEVQGTQHHKFNPFFHKDKKAFATQQANDRRKEQWCNINDITLIKINWGASKENVLKALG
ncbi:hypothetical protein E4G67_00300 [Candidatus Bathyarchaeota archaeon]|nr:MAG: hypothetical protein E4G67_00300 [Candidatus Bathyarchaeota archaeon]